MTPKFRYIHTSIWDDEWFCALEPGQKVLFIWLFSNSRCSISGIFQFSSFVCARETGLPIETVNNSIQEFQSAGKLMLDGEYIWVKNLRKYNNAKGELNNKAIANDLNKVTPAMLQAYKEYYSFNKHADLGIDETYPFDGEDNAINDEGVSIPIDGVSIPFADKDKDKDNRYLILTDKKTVRNYFPIAKSLSEVTGLDIDKNRGRLFRAAKKFKDGEEQQIIREYGIGSTWYRVDWRGQKGQKPTPEQVIETWNNLSIPVSIGKPSNFENNRAVVNEFLGGSNGNF